MNSRVKSGDIHTALRVRLDARYIIVRKRFKFGYRLLTAGEITPSVEIANKIAKALGVSLDFLVGNIDLELSDKLMNRITEVSKMTEKDKDHVFTLLDAFIARTKLQEFV